MKEVIGFQATAVALELVEGRGPSPVKVLWRIREMQSLSNMFIGLMGDVAGRTCQTPDVGVDLVTQQLQSLLPKSTASKAVGIARKNAGGPQIGSVMTCKHMPSSEPSTHTSICNFTQLQPVFQCESLEDQKRQFRT